MLRACALVPKAHVLPATQSHIHKNKNSRVSPYDREEREEKKKLSPTVQYSQFAHAPKIFSIDLSKSVLMISVKWISIQSQVVVHFAEL